MPITLNGVDVETLGFVVSDYTGDLTPAVDAWPGVAVPGLAGEALTGAPSVVPARTLTVNGTVVAATAAALDGAVRAVLAAAAGVATATPGQVALAIAPEGSTPAVQWTVGLTKSSTVKRADPNGLARAAAVSLVFSAQQPYAEDVAETVLLLPAGAPGVIGAGAAGQAVGPFPAGTVPTLPVLELSAPPGSWGDSGRASRTVRLWTRVPGPGLGALLGSLTITPGTTILAGSVLEVDCAAQTVTLIAPDGVTRSPRAAWLSAGDFLALGPADAAVSYEDALAVDLEGAGRVRYRRRWV